MARPVLTIVATSDEQKDIYLDGHLIIHTNHDEHGWSGMEDIERVAREIATRLGARIVERYDDEEPDADDLLTVLRGYFPHTKEDTLLKAVEVLVDGELDTEDVSAQLDLAILIAKEHGLEAELKLQGHLTPGVGKSGNVNVLVCVPASADKTFELNHELAEREFDLVGPASSYFCVVFDPKR